MKNNQSHLVSKFYCKCALCMLAVIIMFMSVACSNKTNIPSETYAPNTHSDHAMANDTVPEKITAEFSDRDLAVDYDKYESTSLHFTNKTLENAIKYDGIKLENSVLSILKEGTYILFGEFSGTINIAVQNTEKVQLVLNGVTITAKDGPAINIAQADKVFITLAENTKNILTDSTAYSKLDSSDEPNAALFSKDDITINGNGYLEVNGNYKHGIVSKDDLTICNLNITVSANGTGIRGKDELAVINSNINVISKTNALDSNNDTDETKGNIIIENSVLNIISSGDGIQAKNTVQLTNTEAYITTANGAPETIKTDNPMMEFHKTQQNSSNSEETVSSKGIKAEKLLRIDGGSFEINSLDDTIHSNGDVVLSADNLTLRSGDDGVHADSNLYVLSGNISIEKSYEGFEGNTITVFDGSMDILANDDGMNAAGGVDSSGMGGMGEFNHDRQDKFSFSSSDDVFIKILGGNINVNASGDGIDSNGAIIVSGGTTIIEGPENNGNGALDYLSYAKINGGFFIALGTSGMALNFSEAENQCAALVNFRSTQDALTPIALFEGDIFMFAYKPTKKYSSVVVSMPEMQLNKTYELKYGGTILNGSYTPDGSKYSGGSTYTTLEFTSSILNINSHNSGFNGGGRPIR